MRSSLQTASKWISDCILHHPKCAQLNAFKTSGITYQPDRLVDISNADEDLWYLRLREEHDIQSNEYATLSHRWSPNQSVRLLRSNIENFKNGQPIKDLPQTFQDAISVARTLKIRYLWIDCLCIVQNHVEDWAAQSLTMRDVYAHSICNISATAAPDNSSGFLGMLEKPVPLPPQVRPNWTTPAEQSFVAVDIYFWWAEILNTPLLKRGWVFQERFLAPRVLHFGARQMLWECASLDACETYPFGLPEVAQSKVHTEFKRLDLLEKLLSQQQYDPSIQPGTCSSRMRPSMNTPPKNVAKSGRLSLGGLFSPSGPSVSTPSTTPRLHTETSAGMPNHHSTRTVARGYQALKAAIDFAYKKSTEKQQDAVEASDESDTEILDFWCSMVQAYTRTSVTVPDDKLVALAGVAKFVSALYHQYYQSPASYLAGLFEKDLPLLLEWHACSPAYGLPPKAGKRVSQYRAPSWSWASIEGRIFFEYLPQVFNHPEELNRRPTWDTFVREWGRSGEAFYSLEENSRASSWAHDTLPLPSRHISWKPLMTIISAVVDQGDHKGFGQVSGGCLQLRGLVIPIDSVFESNPYINYQDARPAEGRLYSGSHCLPLRCIELGYRYEKGRSERYRTVHWMTGLCLQAVDGADNRFQRVGLFCIPSPKKIVALGVELTKFPFNARIAKEHSMRTISII